MEKLSLQEVIDKYSVEHKAAIINDGLLVGFIEEGIDGDDC